MFVKTEHGAEGTELFANVVAMRTVGSELVPVDHDPFAGK